VIVFGRNPVQEALRGKREVERVWATGKIAREDWLAGAGVPVTIAESAAELTETCGSPDHQGVCAEAGDYPYAEAESLLAEDDALVIVLDEVQDPHNLGAVCRVAECAGGAGVVIPERRSAVITPAVCKSAAGAVEHLDVAKVRNVTEYLNTAKDAGAWIYGAQGGAAVSYDQPDYSGKVVLVLGSEGRGLRPRVVGACDELISLPMHGKVGSLNVSAAAAALVYGILQLRGRSLDKAP
jgi:23S rRNA (guanosine2251-2'-O)-methyltransferase